MSQRYIGGLIYNPPGGYSGYFDGSGDYLDSAPGAIGTGDFTLECWVWFNALSSNQGILDTRDNSNTSGFALLGRSNGTISMADGTSLVGTATSAAAGQWIHVAASRASGVISFYVNGTRSGSTLSNTTNFSNNRLRVGAIGSAGENLAGYVSNVRLLTSAIYSGTTITPPNGPLQAISGTSLLTCAYSTFRDGSSNNFTITVNGNTSVSTQNPFPITTLPNPALGNQGNGVYSMSQYVALKAQGLWPAYDPYFDQTTLLLHGDGTNGAQNNTFLDSSTNNFTITRNGNTTQGTFSPFSLTEGQWSNYFGSTTANLKFASNAAFGVGTGNFTVEFFLNISSWSGNQRFFIIGQSGTDGISFGRPNSDNIAIDIANSRIITYGWTPTVGRWYHLALVRSGTGSNQTTLYIDGVSVATGTSSGSVGQNAAFIGGLDWATSYNTQGYISNLRFSNSARTITVPTTPYTSDANTIILSCQSNRFKDNSANNFAITVNGNTSIQPFSPFAPSAAYSAATNGGSGYFDGSGDYFSLPAGNSWLFTGDHCLEAWVYWTNSTASVIYATGGASSADQFGIFPGGEGIWWGVTAQSSAVVPILNSWNHLCATRQGSTIRRFLNGKLITTGTNASNIGTNSGTPYVASRLGSSLYFPGNIANLRIINGSVPTDYQTSSTTIDAQIFTPPTAPLTTTSQGATSGDVKLLLNFTNAGILDNTGRNNLETVGNAQISTSVKKFGTGSMYFDGTGDYLLLRPSQQLIFEGDFTIEFWLYITLASSTYHSPIGNYNGNGTTNWQIEVQNTGVIRLYYNGSSSPIVSASGVITNETWQHIAAVRSGSTVALYVNGSQIGTASFSGALGNTTTNTLIASIPQNTTQEVVGYIDDLRITKGVARYTSNFTPQTSQWQDQ